MGWITAAAIAATAIYQAVDASNRKKKADRALKQLAKSKQQYATLQDAEAAIRQGFSPEQRASFQSQLARSQNEAYKRAVQSNPNLAGAVTAGLNYTNVGAMSDFASRDAELRRQRQQMYLQRNDMETERKIREKQMMEQQYGLAYQQASADITNAFGSGLTGLTTVYSSYQGKSGGKSLFAKK